MSDRKCCVPNCNKTNLDGITLHQFPNPARQFLRFWSWCCAIGGELLIMDNKAVYRNRKVCNIHFEKKYLTRSKYLSVDAVPTLHVPGLIIRGRQPMQDVTNTTQTVEDVLQSAPSSSRGSITTDFENVKSPEPVQPGPSLFKSSMSMDDINVKSLEPVQPGTSECKRGEATRKIPYVTDKLSKLSKQLRTLQASKVQLKLKLKKAMKLSENKTFQEAVKKFSSMALIFTLLQFREIKKNKMGRRFTKKEKVMSLTLYKQSPKAYRWLRKVFVLPAPSTLSRMISRAGLKPGLNENLFQQLRKRVQKMKDDDKLCILLFDEISITPHFDYNRKKDILIGFVNNGKNIKNKIADHALVFMLRGVQKNYKQPITYTFCHGSTNKQELAMLIKEMVSKLHEIGFKVLATVCDQGSSNVSAINHLLQSTKIKYKRNNKEFKNNFFEVEGQQIVLLYDTPHLIKGIRNNLLTKDLKCVIDEKNKLAKWEHIIRLYEENPAYKGIRLMPKLTENHVNPKKISKMKVKCATQVFSQSVAANMGYLAGKGVIPAECQETADVLLFFDSLFDSMNGSYDNSKKRSGKPLLGPVTPNSAHHQIWRTAKIILKSMKYVTSSAKEGVVPSITNWLLTIENIEYLKNIFFENYKIKSFWMRHFNQDPLENFFGSVRSHGYRNTSPTSAGFESAFATLLINNLSSNHSPGANCEKDTCSALKSLGILLFKDSKNQKFQSTEIDFDHISGNQLVGLSNKKDPKIIAELEYVTGYILKNIKKNVSKNFIQCDIHKNNILEYLLDFSCTFFLCNWCKDVNKLLNGTRCDFSKEDPIQKSARDYYLKRRK